MEDKDPKDDELNPQGQDDINDADDSFGLPDLDYKPLEEEDSEEDTEVESNEATTEEETNIHEVDSTYTDTEESMSENLEEEEKPELRYQVEEEKSNTPKILIGIITVLVVAAAIWFFGFYRPQQQKIAEDARIKQEQIDKQKAADDAAQLERAQEAAALAAEEQRLREEAEALAKAGVIILTERTGRYYIVLESFIDDDFAKDYGNRVAKAGTPAWLIPPYSKKKMQRVAIGGYESLDEAKTALSELSKDFGTGKWILKY